METQRHRRSRRRSIPFNQQPKPEVVDHDTGTVAAHWRLQSVALICVALFLAVSLVSYSSTDRPDSLVFPATEGYQNWCGKIGAYTASLLFNALGYAVYLLFAPLISLIVQAWHGKKTDQFFVRLAGMSLLLIGTSALASLFITDRSPGPMIGPGGYLGVTILFMLHNYFATTGCAIIFVSCIIGGLVLACDYTLLRVALWASGVYPIGDKVVQYLKNERHTVTVAVPQGKGKSNGKIRGKNVSMATITEIDEPDEQKLAHGYENAENDELTDDEDEYEYEHEDGDEETASDEENDDESEYDDVYETDDSEDETEEYADDDDYDDEQNDVAARKSSRLDQKTKGGLISWLNIKRPKGSDAKSSFSTNDDDAEIDEGDEGDEHEEDEYALPPVDLLVKSEPQNYDQQEKTVQKQGKQLEKAFADFGYNVKVVDVQTGPVIAQFEVQLERGLRLNKITALTDDIAIALKVPSIRIVAPIPGKNTVGVEVPNENRQLVRLREVIEETNDKVDSMAVPIFLGKDVAGSPMVIDLAKMPHLLIAGRTGTGKSVCLNSIIVSMLMTRSPDECRMILIDPKMVELSPYKSIPHLMHPVVTDMKKAEAILAWAVDKMEQRYQLLANAGVRQLSEYNKLTEDELYRRVKPESDDEWEATPRSLPYLVIVADEMADLMMTAAKEVETHIIRLAQKSRAVGIHLVLATQKPTVDIITGLIKSNLPARIAFEVASRTDSQVVLDRNGAEKLLGNGDLLFLMPGTSQVLRGQGTYVSDKEINDIIDSVATDSPDYVIELVELQGSEDGSGDGWVDPRDDLFNEAVEFLIREGRGSLSVLQRKFKIGYGRAARLIDFMEEDGIVGPHNGSQPREILFTLQQWRNRIAELEHQETGEPAMPQPRSVSQENRPSNRLAVQPSQEQRQSGERSIEKTHAPTNGASQKGGQPKPQRTPEPVRVSNRPSTTFEDDATEQRKNIVVVSNGATSKAAKPSSAPDREHDRVHGASPIPVPSPVGIPKRPRQTTIVEQGVGPVIDIDESMLSQIKPTNKTTNAATGKVADKATNNATGQSSQKHLSATREANDGISGHHKNRAAKNSDQKNRQNDAELEHIIPFSNDFDGSDNEYHEYENDESEYGENEYDENVYEEDVHDEDENDNDEDENEEEDNENEEDADSNDEMTNEDESYEDGLNDDAYGVTPVRDGDVRDEDDGDGEEDDWEYEYVYEEVEVDDDEEDGAGDDAGNGGDDDDYGDEEEDDNNDAKQRHHFDLRALYSNELDLEAGGDWESEED